MERTFADDIKTFSGFTHANINMTEAGMINADITLNKLTLIAGMNGTGKTLLNKLIWASHTFLNMKLVEKVTGIKDTQKDDTTVLQYILDNTFESQDFNGNFEFHSRDEILNVSFYNLKFKIDNGKVFDVTFEYPEDGVPGGGATYLSKDARDFSNIERYLKTKKLLNLDELTNWDDLEKLGTMYKLYDIFAIESLLPKFSKAGDLIKMIVAMGAGAELMGQIDLVDIDFDKEKADIYYTSSKNERRRLSTLSAGEQSIILMLMTTVQ